MRKIYRFLIVCRKLTFSNNNGGSIRRDPNQAVLLASTLITGMESFWKQLPGPAGSPLLRPVKSPPRPVQ